VRFSRKTLFHGVSINTGKNGKCMSVSHEQHAGQSLNVKSANVAFENVSHFKYLETTLTNQRCMGRAMAQAVSHRPVTAEVRVRSRVTSCGICCGQSGTGTGFSPSTSVLPCRFHSIGAPLHGEMKTLIIIIVMVFITGLYNKLQGCGASVASAAGPFSTKKSKLHE
jgi:hypothetical protein